MTSILTNIERANNETSSSSIRTNELRHKLDPDHNIAMLKPPRKWGMPSAAEVQSIKERIRQIETKVAEEALQDHEADAIIKELMLKKAYTAPIRKLPFEILSEIFILCSLSSQRSTPVRISAVCHRWRETILATPLAWTRISPYTEGPNSLAPLVAYVTTFLQRSQRCLLRLDWGNHPDICIRSYNHIQPISNSREQYCECEIMYKIAEHSDRIQYLHTDQKRMYEFIKLGLPSVEYLSCHRWTPTLLLHLAQFPKLSHLRIGGYSKHKKAFEVRQISQTRLQHLSTITDIYGVWSQLAHHNGRTLTTLKLESYFSHPRHLQQSGDLECPVLEHVIVDDQSMSVYSASSTGFTIRLMAPNLKSYQYSSWHRIVRLAHDTDFNKVEHLRTDHGPPLSHYRHLRVLQLFRYPTLILNILEQLEGDYDVCPELSVIEVRDCTGDISSWTNIWGNGIHDRIAARNIKANSNIKLLSKPDQDRWEYSLPDDDDIFDRMSAGMNIELRGGRYPHVPT